MPPKTSREAVRNLLRLVALIESADQHLSTAVALVLLVPTALSMDVRMSMVLLVLGGLYVGIGRLVMKRTKEGLELTLRRPQPTDPPLLTCLPLFLSRQRALFDPRAAGSPLDGLLAMD